MTDAIVGVTLKIDDGWTYRIAEGADADTLDAPTYPIANGATFRVYRSRHAGEHRVAIAKRTNDDWKIDVDDAEECAEITVRKVLDEWELRESRGIMKRR